MRTRTGFSDTFSRRVNQQIRNTRPFTEDPFSSGSLQRSFSRIGSDDRLKNANSEASATVNHELEGGLQGIDAGAQFSLDNISSDHKAGGYSSVGARAILTVSG